MRQAEKGRDRGRGGGKKGNREKYLLVVVVVVVYRDSLSYVIMQTTDKRFLSPKTNLLFQVQSPNYKPKRAIIPFRSRGGSNGRTTNTG